MAAYKDEARGTWYVSFHYNDWTGKNKRKLKRGFRTRREALEYEQKFLLQQATNLDMMFADFYKLYEEDLKLYICLCRRLRRCRQIFTKCMMKS